MRNWMIRRAFYIVVLWSFTILSYGQTNNQAKALAQTVSKKYAGYSTLNSDFVLQLGGKTLQKGQVILDNKSGKYRINMQDQIILSDGKNQWTVLDEVKEVQITEIPKDESGITPKNLFTFFTKGYQTALGAEEKLGNQTVQVLILTPTSTTKSHTKIEMRIVKSNETIQQVKVFEKNGDQYVYSLPNQKPNQKNDPATFVFSKEAFPGYEIVDLR
jgi:outer membrane lipoprotein-sorting protein